MKRKKVVLFIVEGITDKTSLSSVLENFIEEHNVIFEIIDGDITTKDNVTSNTILAELGKCINRFKNDSYNVYKYKNEDFSEIVHLVDMDGAFITDECIIEHDEDIFYDEDSIYCRNRDYIIARNKQKRDNIKKLVETNKILKIVPYSIYYFSSNLEHVLHDETNISKARKNKLSENFDIKYGNDEKLFCEFFLDATFSVNKQYKESWEFIKDDKNSLKRHTNFNLFIDKYYFNSF